MRKIGQRTVALLIVLSLAVAATPVMAQVEVDPQLPDYKRVQGVSGNVNSIGSDTMNNLMTYWLEGFTKIYPNVRFEVEGKGSSTAPPALIAGTAMFGPMSRPMKEDEITSFDERFGYPPTPLSTSIDMLGVFVHKDNPIKALTLPQVDAIFSKTRKLGYEQDVTKWGQVGLKGQFANLPISIYGRNAASGTYGYFKEHVLGKGDYKDSVKEQPGSSAVIQKVGSDRSGIGYSGIGYKTANVRIVPLAADADSKAVPAEPEYASTGEYPLSRSLYLYVNYKPNSKLDPLRREFVKYVFSKQGQEVVVKDGYLPLPAAVAKRELKKLGIAVD